METPGVSMNMYLNVANFDCYDMIIGTLFMRKHRVKLGFLKNQIVVTAVAMPAIRVTVPDTDDCIRCYWAVDKKRD